jgi:hypothetical protein
MSFSQVGHLVKLDKTKWFFNQIEHFMLIIVQS